jgi:hypothetical protein
LHALAAWNQRAASRAVEEKPRGIGFERSECPAGPRTEVDLRQLLADVNTDLLTVRERGGGRLGALEWAGVDGGDAISLREGVGEALRLNRSLHAQRHSGSTSREPIANRIGMRVANEQDDATRDGKISAASARDV